MFKPNIDQRSFHDRLKRSLLALQTKDLAQIDSIVIKESTRIFLTQYKSMIKNINYPGVF